MRHVLVTGGAGFIGGHLVKLLVDSQWSVTVIDDLSTGNMLNLVPAMKTGGRVRLVTEKVQDNLFECDPYDVVFHLAATVGVRRVLERSVETIENNYMATQAAAYVAEVTDARLVFTSSSEVYGVYVDGDENSTRTLGPTTVSRWAYATVKALDEHLLLARAKERGLNVAIARLFNCVGPGQLPDYGMVLPRFVAAALAGKPLEVHGDGSQVRTFCDVRDTVRALYLLGTDERAQGNVYNVGSDQPYTIRRLAELVVETLKSDSFIHSVPYADTFGPGFQDTTRRVPNTRAIRGLGWERNYDLKKTIEDVAKGMRERV